MAKKNAPILDHQNESQVMMLVNKMNSDGFNYSYVKGEFGLFRDKEGDEWRVSSSFYSELSPLVSQFQHRVTELMKQF